VLGQLDNLGALLLGLRHTLRGCPPEIADRHLAATGLTRQTLDDDLRTVGVSAMWLGKKAVQGGRVILSGAARLAQKACQSRET
jgi:hypothetical protein